MKSGNESGKTGRNAGESASQVYCCVCVYACTLATASHLHKRPSAAELPGFTCDKLDFSEALLNDLLISSSVFVLFFTLPADYKTHLFKFTSIKILSFNGLKSECTANSRFSSQP